MEGHCRTGANRTLVWFIPFRGETHCDLHPNLWRPQREGLTHQLFVLKWTHVVERGMSPSPIIKDFNVIKGGTAGLCSCLKRLAINAFTLETMKKAFHDRIIIAVSSTAHAGLHTFAVRKSV
jgi:hypothetical protein